MTTSEKVIKNKLGLLELSQQLGNVSRACKIMGYSRDSFYRFWRGYKHAQPQLLREDADGERLLRIGLKQQHGRSHAIFLL